MCPAEIKVSAASRTLNVRKFAESRAGEVEGLLSILADRLGNNFRSRRNKRRRTTSHDNQLANRRFRKRQKKLLPTSVDSVGGFEDSHKVSRRVRRRNEFKKNPQSGFTTSRDETKRLRTHVWHAKRFTMTKLWGFYLPLGLHGRGMGSRAQLNWYKQGVVAHDASYNSAIQLEGPEESFISVLNTVLMPSLSVDFGGISRMILSGAEYGIAMVRTRDTNPLSPVMYMWRPLEEKYVVAIDSSRVPNGKNEYSDASGSSVNRQCWVWIHASAFVDGHNAISCACQKEMEENGVLINCSSLEGQLAKIDVLGSNASFLLQKLLHSIPQLQGRPSHLKNCSTTMTDKNLHSIDYCMLENEGYSRAVISLIVRDPRLFKDTLQMPSTRCVEGVKAENMEESYSAIIEPLNDESDAGLVQNNLWDVDGRIRPPVDEAFLCMEKHRNRMNSFYLSHCDSEMPNCSDISQCSRSCSIIVVRNNNLQKRFLGWSIILPVSWVKAFWIPIVTNGARAIGLRERHWIACELLRNGLSSLGYDVYLVGGCVRDLILKRTPKDFDVITSAELKEIVDVLWQDCGPPIPAICCVPTGCEVIGRRFPICHVHVNDTIVEVSSFNTSGKNSLRRFNSSIKKASGCNDRDYVRWKNCLKRDFTINGLMFDPSAKIIYDDIGGMEDLRKSKVRTVISADLSFVEDRGKCPIANPEISHSTCISSGSSSGLSFFKRNSFSLRQLSHSVLMLDKGRILMEMNYMLAFGSGEASLRLLWRFGLLELLLPIQASYFVSQGFNRRDEGSNMLLGLFANLDKVVAPDRPCPSSLWVALLAFHKALVDKPREPTVVTAFALAIHSGGSMTESIKIARGISQQHDSCHLELLEPEARISKFRMMNEMVDLAATVKDVLFNMTNRRYVSQAMKKYPQAPRSDLIFISEVLLQRVCNIFECVKRGMGGGSGSVPARSRIDYDSLTSGRLQEVRHLFARIVFDTVYPASHQSNAQRVEHHNQKMEELSDI